MFENSKFTIYEYNKLPLNRDCYLMIEMDMEKYEKYSLGVDHQLDAYVTFIVIRHINESSLEISWYTNVYDRFHEVRVFLPKDTIVSCIDDDVGKPCLFIKDDYINLLYAKYYSIFFIIDTVDMKKAIRENSISNEKLLNLRNSLDSLAEKCPDVSFISFADNLLLKSNWTAGDVRNNRGYTYNPEGMLKIFETVKSIYSDTLNLAIYGVLAQGSNEYYEESLLHISPSKNHVCLNSLGTAFAELLSINESACKAIKLGVHPSSELYIDENLFRSIKFKYGFDINNVTSYAYTTKFGIIKRYYLLTLNEIINNLRE